MLKRVATALTACVVFAGVAALPAGAGVAATTPAAAPASPPPLSGAVKPLPNFTAQGTNLIRLLAGAFDPLAQPSPRPAGIPFVDEASLPAGVAQYWLVQVKDGRFASAGAAISTAGAKVVGVVPDATLMVRATPAQRAAIARSDAVRWSAYYQPAWRVPVAAGGRKGLLQLPGTQTYRVSAFRDDPDPGSVGRALAELDGVEVVEDAGVIVDVRATAAQVPAIAAIRAVEWVGIKPEGRLHNANARWVTDTGVRDVYGATRPGRLNGEGQTAAVADTGVNYKYDLNHRAHVAFRDCNESGICKEAIYTQKQPGSSLGQLNRVVNHGTNHRKMVAYFDLGAAGPQPFDTSGHGSHTGGSVSGDQPPYDAYTGDDGLAPAAMHVHQNIASSSGGLGGLPADSYDLWRQAYRPREPSGVSETSGEQGNPGGYTKNYRAREDARTHNNSYGLIAPIVDDTSAARLDDFVWDHEDMVIVVSAGNEGPGPATIGSPSTAKSDLSSGASANGRQPMASIDSMAVFSSHGPTGDLRFGTDLATPGQIVVSVKGGSERDYHTAQGTSMLAPVLTGLSTLVRQYFFDGYGPAGGKGFAGGAPNLARMHNPSAALVKATLVNGAERMRGWYTGDDGTDRALDGQWPSAGQGFGRVNLDNSLYFNNDPLNGWYHDVYRADPQAFPVSDFEQTRTYQVQVARSKTLDVSLAWTDAPNLLPAGTPALVNNLDLVVTGPSGTFVGNNMNTRTNPKADNAATVRGAAPTDTRNPVERVRILNPEPGTWTISVRADPIAFGNQGFALAASGRVSKVDGVPFEGGPSRQQNLAGEPFITESGVLTDRASSEVVTLRFETNEPTTAYADVDLDGDPATEPFRFVDSYNIGNDPPDPVDGAGWPGLDEGPVETSPQYANKPVLTTRHEIRITGLRSARTYPIVLTIMDIPGNTVTRTFDYKSLERVYQPLARDTAQLAATGVFPEPLPIPIPGTSGWKTGTQMYAGESGGGLLGAFAFRVPENEIDPSQITGAIVEMTSKHNWVVPYNQDPLLYVDLLDQSMEPGWGTQDYETIHNAPLDARAYPETTYKIGAYQRYAFSFNCTDLAALRTTLSTVTQGSRMATFRYDSTPPGGAGLFSMEFGYNRRSRGPEHRPRLILLTNGESAPQLGQRCDPTTPPPTITEVGVHQGILNKDPDDPAQPPDRPGTEVTVSWRTNVDSDSMVLFREKGTTQWTQVGTPIRTKVHHVEVFGLDPEQKDYEFILRSATCSGAATFDTNKGKGYEFFRGASADVPREDWFFHGTPGDEAASVDFTLTPATFSKDPPDNVAGFQHVSAIANQDFVGNFLGAYWYGDYSGEIGGDVSFSWYWSAASQRTVALGEYVTVTVFADPKETGTAVQPERIIGRGSMKLEFTAPGVPTLNRGFVPVSGTVQGKMLIQVAANSLTEGEDLTVHYDSAVTPSKFGVPTVVEPPTGPLPLTGPVPPASAGGNITTPTLRRGAPTEADITAGTSWCGVPEATVRVVADGHGHSDYRANGVAGTGDVHVRTGEVYDDLGDGRAPTGDVEYWDLRNDPPGAIAAPVYCGPTVPTSTARISGRSVRIEGPMSCVDVPDVARFRLTLTEGGAVDEYRMEMFSGSGATVYDWSGTTTAGLGNITIRSYTA